MVRIFRSTEDAAFAAAVRKAREECLATQDVRDRWRRALKSATALVRSFAGEPATLANGRQYEFMRQLWHLDKYEERHGHA